MTTVDAQGSLRSLLRRDDGLIIQLPGERWVAPVDATDHLVLQRAVGPVLDLGCGPGRHCQALAQEGVVVLGIDLSSHAVGLARSKGVSVLERSVFETIPRGGHWGTALLLDGNIGMGGKPERLLARAAELLRPDGRVLLEVSALSEPTVTVQLELDGEPGPWFDWAVVGKADLADLAKTAGLTLVDEWTLDGRHFGQLERLRP